MGEACLLVWWQRGVQRQHQQLRAGAFWHVGHHLIQLAARLLGGRTG